MFPFGFRPSDFFRISDFGLRFFIPPFPLLILLSIALSGCVCPKTHTATSATAVAQTRKFDFQRDTFAFPNQLLWIYEFDSTGKWVSHKRDPKPSYWLRCFVLARSAKQFFVNARFAPDLPAADEATYRHLIHEVVHSNPRAPLLEDKKIVVPGYADLRSFSREKESLLKTECGGPLQSYFQRGHWRMIMPFTHKGQEKMARQLVAHLNANGMTVVHVSIFPQLGINHALVLFGADETDKAIVFQAYDPNEPDTPTTLTFDRSTRDFILPQNRYFPGGKLDAYEVYHKWDY